MNSDILIYQNPDGNIKIDVRLQEETVWLTQSQMGQLFGKDKRTISEHITNIYRERELEKNPTVRKFRTVQTEGNRDVERELDHYKLDVIIPVGYRVKNGVVRRDFWMFSAKVRGKFGAENFHTTSPR